MPISELWQNPDHPPRSSTRFGLLGYVVWSNMPQKEMKLKRRVQWSLKKVFSFSKNPNLTLELHMNNIHLIFKHVDASTQVKYQTKTYTDFLSGVWAGVKQDLDTTEQTAHLFWSHLQLMILPLFFFFPSPIWFAESEQRSLTGIHQPANYTGLWGLTGWISRAYLN